MIKKKVAVVREIPPTVDLNPYFLGVPVRVWLRAPIDE